MDKGWYALIGGAVAIALPLIGNFIKELYFENLKRKTEHNFIVIQLVFLLDKFSSECSKVSYDNGFAWDQPDQEYAKTQVEEPVFSPYEIKGEFKFLDKALLYKIHKIAILQSNANRRIAEFAAADVLPDFSSTFESRQCEYCKLGIFAANLAKEIRTTLNLTDDEWSAELMRKSLIQRLSDLTNEKVEREARMRRSLEELKATFPAESNDVPAS